MTYLIGEIAVYLVVAGLLGAIAGWLAARISSERTERRREAARRHHRRDPRPPAPPRSRAGPEVGAVARATGRPSVVPPAEDRDSPSSPSGSREGAAPVLGPAVSEAPADDLTAIRGIGPVLAERLRGLGVTTYREIARWGDEEVDRFDEALGGVRGRIRRDGWVESARRLDRTES